MDFSVDISSQIAPSFYSQLESKKWSDRKEALDVLEKVTAVSRIKNADFTELVRVLKKTVAKDANIVVVQAAAKCIYQLALGLRYDFAPYSNSCLLTIFEKFKEKKPHVIQVLRDAADAVFLATNLENIYEDVIQFLDNKNPQVKAEMCLFMARTFANYPAQVMNKRTLRPLINALIKTLADTDATVRDNSAMAIGTAMKVSGEKLMMTMIADVEPIKLAKIKESCEKAEIVSANGNAQDGVGAVNGAGQENQDVAQTNGIAGGGGGGGQEDGDGEDDEDRIYEMLDAVDISSQIPASFYSQMESKKWSERKEALDSIEKLTAVPKIKSTDFTELVRVLKKTVAKDANIVVVQAAAKCIHQLATGLRHDFAPYSYYCLLTIFEKFKEKKSHVIQVLRDAADACFVSTNLENIYEDVNTFLDNKNPQIKSELCLFLARAFAKYPAQVMNKKTLRPLINALIKTLSDTDATVRDNSAMAIGTAMKVSGEKLMMTMIADVEPIKLPKIKEFCENAKVKKIPKAALMAMNNNSAPPAAPQVNHAAPPRNSSATMIRSTSNRRLTVAASKPAVQRNATFKRAAAPKRTLQKSAVSSVPTIPAIPQVQSIPAAPLTPAAPAVMAVPAIPSAPDTGSLILKLISDNSRDVLDGLTSLEALADSDLKSRVNNLIDLSSLQLVKSFDCLRTNPSVDQTAAQRIQRVSNLVKRIFSRPQLLGAAGQQSIRFLLLQLFTLTQACGSITDDGIVPKTLSNLTSAVMDSFEPTEIMCILTKLLNEPTPLSIVEPVKDAIIRSMRSFK